MSATSTSDGGAGRPSIRPFQGRVYLVNQDNRALPAFETCVLEAKIWAAEVDASL